jgi:hypothetical protein
LSKRAIDLGADPEDIAQTTAQKVDKVAGDYQTYYNDTHENTFFKFLLAAGGLFLGAYGLSQVLGAAGAGATGATAAAAPSVGGGFVGGGYGSIGPAGFTSAAATPAYVGTNIPNTIFKTPTMPGYISPGGAPAASGTELLGGGLKLPGSVTGSTVPGASGVGNIKVASGQGLAPNVGAKVGAGAQQIGTGSVGLKFPGVTTPPGGLSSFVNKAKDVLDTASDLSDVVGGGQQPRQLQQVQVRGQVPIYRNPAELFPVTNTMMSPLEILERQTVRPRVLGGLGMTRNLV